MLGANKRTGLIRAAGEYHLAAREYNEGEPRGGLPHSPLPAPEGPGF